jgi:hypothetical protein
MSKMANVPWTPFDGYEADAKKLGAPFYFVNSRYTVFVRKMHSKTYGDVLHLSIKTNDRAPHHDWRDFQRIKNELIGPEFEAIEIYPAESRLVDTSNQYHLWVLIDAKLDIGFHDGRFVTEASWGQALQRPFDDDNRPSDLLTREQVNALVEARTSAIDKPRRSMVSDFVRELAEEDCRYNDRCPDFVGSRHGRCLPCKAREAIKFDKEAS